MTFLLTYRLNSTYKCKVEAVGSLQKAIEIADKECFGQANFGEAKNVEGEVIVVEDENGQRIFDKTISNPETEEETKKKKTKKYSLIYRVSAYYQCKVEAVSMKDAIEIADKACFEKANFGEAKDVEGTVIVAEIKYFD